LVELADMRIMERFENSFSAIDWGWAHGGMSLS
jgi:hypothetical protein